MKMKKLNENKNILELSSKIAWLFKEEWNLTGPKINNRLTNLPLDTKLRSLVKMGRKEQRCQVGNKKKNVISLYNRHL